MDDESGESMEPMEEVPLIQLGDRGRIGECVVDGGEPGVDSRDEGKHTGRNDLNISVQAANLSDCRI